LATIFDGLGHVAIKVNDLDASLAFYEKLGFPEILRLLDKAGKPWIVYLRITDTTLLELFPGGTGRPVAGPEATGVNHLSLAVHDLDATEAALAAAGVSLSRPRTEGRGLDGNRGMWIEDPDGNRIEIMEMAPDCIQARALARLRDGKPPEALSLS
jgi:catechol 2,3-dioxygenase-like lactoylglutathione lyase family enzyme